MSRTLTAPPTDRRMWRRLLATVHPDGGGTHELFIWVSALFEHVAGDHPEPVVDDRSRRARHEYTDVDRVPYEDTFGKAGSFAELTRQAVMMAGHVEEPFASLLRMLADCHESYDGVFYRHQHQGATYKSLAAIAYRAGMSKAQRIRWYRICESIPMSQRHAGHLLEHLQRRAA